MKQKILLIIAVAFFILISGIYADEIKTLTPLKKETKKTKTLTPQQKEAKEWFEKAQKLRKTSNDQLEIEYYTKAIELDPNFTEAYYYRGYNYALEGNFDQAIKDCNKAVEIDSKDAKAYFFRGLVYYIKGDYENPIRDLAKIVDCFRDYLIAEMDFTEAIKLNPNLLEAYYYRGLIYRKRGNLYFKKGDYVGAIGDFTKVIKLNPNNAKAYYLRGDTYREMGNYKQAMEDLTRAIKLNPNYAKAYYSRGLTYKCLEMPTNACDDFYQAGILYLKQNKMTKALECVDLMKQTDSSSPLIKKLMKKIYEQK
jgi:tetratricopeptide (TPR) repeat protein